MTRLVSFVIPDDIKKKLQHTWYERKGGGIIDPAGGTVIFKLREQAPENYTGTEITISVPGYLSPSMETNTFGYLLDKYHEFLAKEMDNEYLSKFKAVIENNLKLLCAEGKAGQEILNSFEDCFGTLGDMFGYNLNIVDRRGDFKSFPILKICIFISVCLSSVYYSGGQYEQSMEWLLKAREMVITAMKKYPTVHCKHFNDIEYYENIAVLPAEDFIRELREVITSPAGKPKIKFPPLEVIHLWCCMEFLNGYIAELEFKKIIN